MPIVNSEVFESKTWLSKFQMGAKVRLGEKILIDFLHELSRQILQDPRSKEFPDLITVGFFCRKSSIQKILLQIPELDFRRGVGSVIHIAPGNIPVNFAFSLFMGMLSGNSNLVRLPTREFKQVDLFIELFDRVVSKPAFQQFLVQTIFFKSDRNSFVLNELIKNIDALVVWGGNNTVGHFRSLLKAPNCIDLYFPNRVSSSLISAESVIKCTAKEIKKLCLDFYNDTYLVDQNACSSPNHLIWIGSQERCSKAQAVFWANMDCLLQSKYQPDPVAKIDRILDVIHMIDYARKDFVLNRNYENIWRHSDTSLIHQKMRYGLFIEGFASNLENVPRLLRKIDQTLTVFGFDTKTLFDNFAEKDVFFDRIVPIGRALDMGVDWDGKNMLIQLSKKTQVN